MDINKTASLPVISIVTVVLNAKNDLLKTIESVIHQTYSTIEYIIIDGGSTDGTVDVIKQYQDYITYWVSEPDQGISDAFNKGIDRATGRLIGLLNAGDQYQPNAVEIVVHEYLNATHKNTFLCTGNLFIIEWDAVFKADKNYAFKIPFMMPVLNHPACFVASEIYQTIGHFNINIKIAMDFEFLKRCHKAGIQIQCIDALLVIIDGFGVSEKQYWRGYAEVLKYSDNKLLTLLLPPYIIMNRAILSLKKLLRKGGRKGNEIIMNP